MNEEVYIKQCLVELLVNIRTFPQANVHVLTTNCSTKSNQISNIDADNFYFIFNNILIYNT